MLSGESPAAEGRNSLPLPVHEAARQLDVCNACRYCEGLCAVFPALSRRRMLDAAAVTQLASLCHDCRACFDACMYATPHEFGIDLPLALSHVRVYDYRRLVWPTRLPPLLSGWRGVATAFLAPALVFVVLAVAHCGWSGLVADRGTAQSPYALIPYSELVAVMAISGLFCLGVMADATRRYWREAGGTPEGRRTRAVLDAIWYAATLRYLRGGGQECYYPEDDVPSPQRRRLHSFVAYGFALCLVSTTAAGVSQDLLGEKPPYPVLSVPVMCGVLGGIGLVVGCAGLLLLKRRSALSVTVAQMTVKDYGLLVALLLLAVTGLAVLLTRDTSAYGVLLLIHLAAVAEAFMMAPYSKFIHVVFRFSALVRENLERDEAN